MKRVLARIAAVGCVAVAVTSAAQPAGAAEWRSVALPFLWSDAGLWDVAAESPDRVWVSGHQGAYCWQPISWAPCVSSSPGNPVVRRWDGSGWKEYSINGWTGTGKMYRVSAGGGRTWITGGPNRNTYLGRFTGSAFEPVARPDGGNVSQLSAGPAGVWVTSSWAADDGRFPLYRRTGDTWTRENLPDQLRSVRDIQQRTPTDVWAVGAEKWGRDPYVPAVAHWDGTSWTNVPPPAVTDTFVKVAPVGPDDAWAATRKTLQRWDGSGWAATPLPEGYSSLQDLAVDASGTPWVAMFALHPGDHAVFRYSGGTWQKVTAPSVSGPTDLATVPGTGAVWVVGSDSEGAPLVATNS